MGLFEYKDRKTGLVFVRIPAGCFRMEIDSGDSDQYEAEHGRDVPRRAFQVCVSSYLIGKYEVSQTEWRGIMGGEDPSSIRGFEFPVNNVGWDDCTRFCRRSGLRLPSEAQWEYACRAGRGPMSGVSSYLRAECWSEENSGGMVQAVGVLKANPWGVHDILGNVREWCADVFDGEFFIGMNDGAVDPVCVEGQRNEHVNRGGSFFDPFDVCVLRAGTTDGKALVFGAIYGMRAAYYPIPD